MPTSSSLVTNLPADFNTFGQAVDTSMQYLLGGTTGQVLSKTSATNMAFTWVTPTDQTPLTTKGDLFTFTTVDARLAVGSNGETLVADSSATTGLRWQGDYAAGKNKILNSDSSIWQRGTSFTATGYTADRWYLDSDTTSYSVSRQTFTPGTAPVAGYEGQFFTRLVRGTGGSFVNLQQRIEDVRTFAGQTVTLSFWAKASATCTIEPYYIQSFGSGGSGAVSAAFGTSTLTTSWVRYTYTVASPSVSGKTIGTSSYLNILTARITSATNVDVDTWGVQIEAGSVATAFQTATGTIQGELAACQRYYYRATIPATPSRFGMGMVSTTTTVDGYLQFPTIMRTTPTALEQSGTAGDYSIFTSGTTITVCSAVPAFGTASPFAATVAYAVASGLTAGQAAFIRPVNTNAYLGWSAEL